MSTTNPLALYQIETFGAGIRHNAPHGFARREGARDAAAAETPHRSVPPRASEFLVQMMVDGDGALRAPLGRRDVAERREAAYGAALANRPSARPLSFLRVVGAA